MRSIEEIKKIMAEGAEADVELQQQIESLQSEQRSRTSRRNGITSEEWAAVSPQWDGNNKLEGSLFAVQPKLPDAWYLVRVKDWEFVKAGVTHLRERGDTSTAARMARQFGDGSYVRGGFSYGQFVLETNGQARFETQRVQEPEPEPEEPEEQRGYDYAPLRRRTGTSPSGLDEV